MTDNDLIRILVSTLRSGLTARGLTDVLVQSKAQPAQQGVPYGRCVFFEKLFDKLYGYPKEDLVYREATDDMLSTMRQKCESTFQISALAVQMPGDSTRLTASDLANTGRSILLAFNTIQHLQSLGVGVLRVDRITNPYFENDSDRMEAIPSFDVVFTYEKLDSFAVPVISKTEYDLNIG